MDVTRDPRYDILFEPVRIGPVTARNRFYQVPHADGMGYRDPSALAAMRGVKAEGGWAVVSTGETEIHPSSEASPYVEGRMWDDGDIPAHRLVVEAIHAHNSLAAVELSYAGMATANLYARTPPVGPGHHALDGRYAPIQAREMTLDDIADLRRWHRMAVRRSLEAGYDIVYVYAGHSLSTLQHFLSPRLNHRTDAYGGSLESRSRLLREILEDTLDEVDGAAAVACRMAVDEMLGPGGYTVDDTRRLLGLIGELPDLWDFMLGEWEDDTVSARFGDEGGQEEYVRGLKALTTKPVVGVGRFTSPDTMVRMIRRGILDFIGAARPSIADPFLPSKVESGRIEDIRECIGCNVCTTGDLTMTPIRCTQNPSMGEEWRRGWHPERFTRTTRPGKIMIVGGGPAGLEAATAAGKRGYEVVLVEATRELGGRARREATLPGLATWRRVVDYRTGQLDALSNVDFYLESAMTGEEILDYDFAHIAVATGSTWRRDGVGHAHRRPIPIDPEADVLTPDGLLDGRRPHGHHVVIFDDDHYYLAGVFAELLIGEGYAVTLVTPAPDVSHWTHNTLEQGRIQRRLLQLDVDIVTNTAVDAVDASDVTTRCVFTNRMGRIPADSVVLVTSRLPNDALAADLRRLIDGSDGPSVHVVGDAFSPGTIQSSVWDGRRFAEELDRPDLRSILRRNVSSLDPVPPYPITR